MNLLMILECCKVNRLFAALFYFLLDPPLPPTPTSLIVNNGEGYK